MTLNVLVGSNTTAILLLKLMEPEQQAELVTFRCAHPTSSLYAAAKTLLEIRNEPVALVLDADSTEPRMAARVRDEAAEVIGESAAAAPLRILVAVPAVESLLFRRAGGRATGLRKCRTGFDRLGPREPWRRAAEDERDLQSLPCFIHDHHEIERRRHRRLARRVPCAGDFWNSSTN